MPCGIIPPILRLTSWQQAVTLDRAIPDDLARIRPMTAQRNSAQGRQIRQPAAEYPGLDICI
jgi:hypothetical protein